MFSRTLLGIVALAVLSLPALAKVFDHQHQTFTQVLQDVVRYSADMKQTRVDYAQLFQQPEKLHQYLTRLSAVKKSEYDLWSDAQQLSFLLNAYNGFTLQLIIQNYAKFERGDADSIKDLGSFFSSPWKKSFFTLLDEQRSLDNIEHDMIRVWFKRPRIHAAVVCAAVSCPPLRGEAYVADKLENQLDDQMRLFLSDPQNNSVNLSKNRLRLSSIFKWYADDFSEGQQGFNNIKDLIQLYAADMAHDPQQLLWLQKQQYRIRYHKYDWRLNDIGTF